MASSKYTDIISTFPVGIYILHLEDDQDDKSFRILAFNTYAEKEIGVPCDKYVNKPLFDLFPGMEGGMSCLLKQVSQTKKECNFGVVPYSDNRIKYSLFKMRAFPLPSKCVALMLENTSKESSNATEKTDIFMSIITQLESSLDSILQDIYKQSHKGVLSHMLCHLLSFFASQLNEKSEKIETTDVMNVVDMVLLSEKYSSNDLIRQFLITYRYFTTPSILLNVLILRCMIQGYYLKRKPDEEEKLLSRTVSILVEWLDNHFYDFVTNRKLLSTIKSFISVVVSKSEFQSVRSWEHPLLTLLDEKLRSQKVILSVPIRKIVSHQSVNSIDVLELPPAAWANQMTMVLAERFYAIKNPEFYKGAWTKSDKDFKSPNVTTLIEMNNRFTKWIITEIVSCFNPTTRVQVLKHFIEMCHETFHYKDFESFFIIATALMNSSVSRLTATWKSLDSKTTKMWSKLEVFATPLRNFAKFREHLTELKETYQNPIIPYLALCLRDLSVIDETNESYMDDRINFRKMELLAAPVSQIMNFQQNEFRFPRNLRIKAYLLHDIPLLHEKEQYENSLICQPIGDSSLSPDKLRKLSQSSPKLPRSAVTSPGKSSSPAIARKLFGTLSASKDKLAMTQNKRGSMPESFFNEAAVNTNKSPKPVRLSRKQSCDDFTISYEKLIMKTTTTKESEVLREFDKNILDSNLEVILEEMASVNGKMEMKNILEAKLKQLDCN